MASDWRLLLLWVHDCPCHASVWYGMVVCLSVSSSVSRGSITVMDMAMCITLCVIP